MKTLLNPYEFWPNLVPEQNHFFNFRVFSRIHFTLSAPASFRNTLQSPNIKHLPCKLHLIKLEKLKMQRFKTLLPRTRFSSPSLFSNRRAFSAQPDYAERNDDDEDSQNQVNFLVLHSSSPPLLLLLFNHVPFVFVFVFNWWFCYLV